MIRSFSYEDLDSGWTLEEVRFEALNLLVGPSGAGKTRILDALLDVQRAALAGARGMPSSRWTLSLEVEGEPVVWEAETRVGRWETPLPAALRGDWRAERTDARFVAERIVRSGRPLVERNGESFRFDEGHLPRLTETESAIELLSSEDAIRPLHEAMRLWRSLEVVESLDALDTLRGAEESRRRFGGDLDRLRRDDRLSSLLKLFFLQEDHPELFARIVEDFVEIFPTVHELKAASYADLGFNPDLGNDFMASSLALGLREEGVPGWMLHTAFSSGMEKTLIFLIETTLATKGTVLLIDELENSLGTNCLPEVAGRMLEGLDRVQYLATSHHPRVIYEIPFECWKLVNRRGSTVRVLDAGNIAELKNASPLERFTELINLPEYAEGIA